MDLPSLIEPNSRAYLVNNLKKCHETRVGVYYYVFNFGVLFIFVLIFGLALYFCYTNKPSDYEKKQQMLKEQNFILNKIRYHQENYQQQKQSMSNITSLPFHYNDNIDTI